MTITEKRHQLLKDSIKCYRDYMSDLYAKELFSPYAAMVFNLEQLQRELKNVDGDLENGNISDVTKEHERVMGEFIEFQKEIRDMIFD